MGPYLLLDRLTAQQCRGFLETVLPGLLDDVPLVVRWRLLFHQDRTAVHCIWQWFNATNPRRWNGSQGPIAWSPQLQDVTLKVYSPWGHLKECVCVGPPRTTEDFVARLEAAMTAVDARILRPI
jgi:hypothetical protein